MYYDVDFIRENMNYNPETGVLSWAKPKQGRKVGSPLGNLDKDGYLILSRVVFDGKKRVGFPRYCVHRIIWIFVHGKPPKDQIDHINGDKSDNRLCNLREANTAENMRNVGKQAHNTSGLKGVSFHKHTNKWRANITLGRKQIHIGVFDCPAAAFFSYQVFADIHHGKFARYV
jgi:hypothetical protein